MFKFLSLVEIGPMVLEKNVFKGQQWMFAESLSNTGDPLQKPLLGKDNKLH